MFVSKIFVTGSALAAASVVSAQSNTDEVRYASVYVSPDLEASVVEHASESEMRAAVAKRKPTATGSFADTLMKTGWGVLEVRTNGDKAAAYDAEKLALDTPEVDGHKFSLAHQGYAAGYMEGHLTAHRMNDNIVNLWKAYFPSTSDASLVWQWMHEQDDYMRAKALEKIREYATEADTDDAALHAKFLAELPAVSALDTKVITPGSDGEVHDAVFDEKMLKRKSRQTADVVAVSSKREAEADKAVYRNGEALRDYNTLADKTLEKKFWLHTSFLIHQFDGMKDAYAKAYPEKDAETVWREISLVNAVGDLIDLNTTLARPVNSTQHSMLPTSAEKFLGLSREVTLAEKLRNFGESDDGYGPHIKDWLFSRSMCSAIFKTSADLKDIYYGHSSWFTYSATNRIYKHYHFLDSLFAATSMSFSSYAGYMSSLDDFYLMNSGLVMIQTSLSVLDKKRLAMQEKNGLLAWHRVRNANAIATTGPEWAELLGYQNSGTYNNEYMVLNLNKFRDFESGSGANNPEPEPLKDELLYLVEQIPRLVAHGDVTPILRYGYFPSYNEPYFKEVYVAAGYAAYVNKTHDFEETHSLAPRATIFRRDQHEADSHEGVMKILRSNNYKVDPLSKGSPRKAVCSRGDLDSLFVAPTDVKGLRSGEYKSSVSYVFGNEKVDAELETTDMGTTAKYLQDVMKSVKVPSGCYDTKISSTKWTKQGLQAQVVSGPTVRLL